MKNLYYDICFDKGNNNSANTKNMIAFCHIINEFEKFRKNLSSINAKNYESFVQQLYEVSTGNFKIGAKKAKKFYNENKSVIDTINKYSQINEFLIELDVKYETSIVYKYIMNNKSKTIKIIGVLEELKYLGFERFTLDEEFDFTKKTYEVDKKFKWDFKIIYVDNIEIIPNYGEAISYKTTNSNYEMNLEASSDNFSNFGKKIYLNSLVFDKNRLPKKIDKETIFNLILNLKNSQKKRNTIIRDSVDMNIKILDFQELLDQIDKRINNLSNIEYKEKLVLALASIKNDFEKLKEICSEYDSSIIKQEPLLTKEILDNEKKLQLRMTDPARYDY